MKLGYNNINLKVVSLNQRSYNDASTLENLFKIGANKIRVNFCMLLLLSGSLILYYLWFIKTNTMQAPSLGELNLPPKISETDLSELSEQCEATGNSATRGIYCSGSSSLVLYQKLSQAIFTNISIGILSKCLGVLQATAPIGIVMNSDPEACQSMNLPWGGPRPGNHDGFEPVYRLPCQERAFVTIPLVGSNGVRYQIVTEEVLSNPETAISYLLLAYFGLQPGVEGGEFPFSDDLRVDQRGLVILDPQYINPANSANQYAYALGQLSKLYTEEELTEIEGRVEEAVMNCDRNQVINSLDKALSPYLNIPKEILEWMMDMAFSHSSWQYLWGKIKGLGYSGTENRRGWMMADYLMPRYAPHKEK